MAMGKKDYDCGQVGVTSPKRHSCRVADSVMRGDGKTMGGIWIWDRTTKKKNLRAWNGKGK